MKVWRVSILMPLYNTAATLVESLESVYAQDFADWELILFDDGSTDGTVELAQQAARSYPEKVRFFQHQDKQNKGAAITRNCAFEKSLGELITFLDGDDLWLPGRLSAHIQLLQNNPSAAMLWGPAEYFGDGMIAFEQPTGLPATARLYLPPKLAENFVLNVRGTPCPSATTIKRAVFKRSMALRRHSGGGKTSPYGSKSQYAIPYSLIPAFCYVIGGIPGHPLRRPM